MSDAQPTSVVVATHGYCFDGMCAAALFWLWRGTDRSSASRLARVGLTLVMLAHAFLTLETLRRKKNFWVDPAADAS